MTGDSLEKCQARSVAWYGIEEDADSQTIDVEKCRLCGGHFVGTLPQNRRIRDSPGGPFSRLVHGAVMFQRPLREVARKRLESGFADGWIRGQPAYERMPQIMPAVLDPGRPECVAPGTLRRLDRLGVIDAVQVRPAVVTCKSNLMRGERKGIRSGIRES